MHQQVQAGVHGASDAMGVGGGRQSVTRGAQPGRLVTAQAARDAGARPEGAPEGWKKRKQECVEVVEVVEDLGSPDSTLQILQEPLQAFRF